jgi:hypothetical protein
MAACEASDSARLWSAEGNDGARLRVDGIDELQHADQLPSWFFIGTVRKDCER